MRGMRIVKVDNATAGFYALVGPLLSRREIVKEIGGTVWDDDGKTWWVAVLGGRTIGCVAAREIGGHMVYGSAYVLPEFRRRGVYRALVLARDEATGDAPVRATCTDASLPVLLARGFAVTGAKGRFTKVARP